MLEIILTIDADIILYPSSDNKKLNVNEVMILFRYFIRKRKEKKKEKVFF